MLEDTEAIQELQAKVTIASTSPTLTEKALLTVALLQWHTGHHDSARAYLKKMIDGDGSGGNKAKLNSSSSSSIPQSSQQQSSTTSPAALCAMGWIDLTCGKEFLMSRSSGWFDRVLENNARDLEALMGRLEFFRKQRRQLTPAFDITSQIIVYCPSFVPAYTERMYILLEMASWDQVQEAAQRLNSLSSESIDALLLICLNELCREGNWKMAATYLGNLNKLLAKVEPGNAELYYTVVRPFVRLANRQPGILEQCAKMVESAIAANPKKSEYKAELGYIRFLQGNVLQAKSLYQTAVSLDPQSVKALEGLTRCQLFNGEFFEAEEHLEAFNHLQLAIGKSPETVYLSSLLAWYKHKNMDKRLRLLKEAVKIQLDVIKSSMLSLEYYVAANPDFLLEIVRDYMEFCPSEPKREGEDANPILSVVQDILEVVGRIVPGSTEAILYLAKVKFLAGDKMSAQLLVSNCLKLDNGFAKAHILMAQIHLSNAQFKLATQSLEMGLSYNFEVRHLPLFHIVKAKALKSQEKYDDALATLNAAMALPGMKDAPGAGDQLPKVNWKDTAPTLSERVTLFLELADTESKLKHMHEAAKIMEDALRLFQGTPQQDRITIANANLALERGEIDTALQVLSSITSDQPFFIEAKSKMADIYLKHKNDRKGYARCYSEMVEKNPTVESCLLLGDAYMNIQEPDKAIAIYQSALDQNPDASILASKIGKALVRTHEYNRAIQYYESALSTGNKRAGSTSPELRYDLADLYRKLRQYDEAERVVEDALNHPKSEEVNIITMDVKLNVLLAQINKGNGNFGKAISALSKSRELQISIISRETGATSPESKAARMLLSNICFELAELFVGESGGIKDLDRAVTFYEESIQYNPTHKKSMLALCKLHMSKNDLTAAQDQCATMLRMDVGTEEATMMMADIMFKKNSYSSAVYHFQQLLENNPTNYAALSQLVEMMRRSGKLLDEAEKYFQVVEKKNGKAGLQAGYHFCRGLYHRYTNNPNLALKEFNQCRRDVEWGEQSLYHMIEIFLNPDNDTIGGEALESVTDDDHGGGGAGGGGMSTSAGDKEDSELLAILTADKLLKELPQNPKSLRTQILEGHALLATKQKAEIERALNKFMEILNREKEYMPALLGTAVAYMLLKQPPRARNQLKRISKMEWKSEFADDFERSWLLLGDIYIHGGKFDLATELLRRCLNYNKSCSKAWEYLGHIMEKESSYKDAAEHYENAWKLDRESNPAMGFKLAFNYLKAHRHVDAIDVAHKVLTAYPEYPKIRKEILEKARTCIRMPF
ncbi:Tetratricopeptide repeat protein 21B [Quaeritorhiza haematococci]|nr:Tetratricopeptide repeat protein 21B [Quaeritorhiza haematococci]